jgi:hypothetical protein
VGVPSGRCSMFVIPVAAVLFVLGVAVFADEE